MQIDFQVDIGAVDTSVDVDDSDVWDAVAESVEDAAREAVSEYAWGTVESEVQSCVEEYVDNNGHTDIDGAIENLLSEYSRRVQGELTLCAFGRSFQRAIELTNGRLSGETEGEADLAVIHARLDKIETTLRDIGAVLQANTEPF